MKKKLIDNQIDSQLQLLSCLSSSLRLPLVQTLTEIQLIDQGLLKDTTVSKILIKNTIRLIEAYEYSLKLRFNNSSFKNRDLVSIDDLLYQTSSSLKDLASIYNVNLAFDFKKSQDPIITNKQATLTALESITSSLIINSQLTDTKGRSSKRTIHLASHRTKYGIVAGVYLENNQLAISQISKNRLAGKVYQPIKSFQASSSSGLFIAQNILESLNSKLTASKHQHMRGYGFTLEPSHQLSFV